MLEGALKYGRHNWREVPVRAGVYYDAALRHLMAWWEGEDEDPDSGVHHVTKAIASLVVLRDALMRGAAEDDRPPPSPAGWMAPLNRRASELLERHGRAGRGEFVALGLDGPASGAAGTSEEAA